MSGVSADPRLRQDAEEICRVGRSLFERGYVHATAGNVSVRLDDSLGGGFLMTPTDACLGMLEPEQLAVVSRGGEHIAGARPSKTLRLHQRIYEEAPEARCILHTHSTHLVALTLAGVWKTDCILPPITPYFVMKVGPVPLIDYHAPGDPAAADLIVETIQRHRRRGISLRAVMCDRLGPQVWHESPQAAMASLEELEETARLWLMLQHQVKPMGEADIDTLRQRFNAQWPAA